MIVFIDFEASSTSKASYPIEVAWVFEDGASDTYLIKPAETWTDWDDRAQAVHGIDRDLLVQTGTLHEVVARRMVEVLSGHRLFASAPSWDGKWLSKLLRDAGWPRHTLRLQDTEVIQVAAVEAALDERGVSDADRSVLAVELVAQTKRELEAECVAHRALPDAQRERMILIQAADKARRQPFSGQSEPTQPLSGL